MTKLSLNQGWNETAAFVKREARLLFPIALLLVALPMTAVRLVTPVPGGPGELPEAGPWIIVLPLALVVAMVGNLAVTRLALRPGTSVAEALSSGLRRMPVLLAADLLICLAAGAASFLVIVLFAILFGGGGGSPPSTAEALRVASLSLIALLPLGLYVYLWISFAIPVAVAEQAGPLTIIRRSWHLIRSSVWTLMGFSLMVWLLIIVIWRALVPVIGSLLILVVGPQEPGSLTGILMLIVQALISMVTSVYTTVMVARLYAQLAGSEPSAVAA
jgi:hypothetical protein